jgi:Tfp pilus assembly protein PilF
MKSWGRSCWVLAILAALGGCATHPFQTEAERTLQAGIKNYDEGDYKTATKALQTALNMGLTDLDDQVKAHKYLAFINCISGREKQCRDEFRKVLDIDPGFTLEPAEAGHPSWGPVFRSVKSRK